MQETDKITFSYLINSRNIDGDIYSCDIERFFGLKLPREKRNEIKEQLKGINVKDN